MKWLHRILFVLMLPLWPAFWLMCRIKARQCPRCSSKWRTELVGEWDGEFWKCHNCGCYWDTPYVPSKKGEA